MKMKKILVFALCLTLLLAVSACGKKDKENYNFGDIKGKATGTVEMTESGLYVEIDDILADVGDEVDFTSGIKFKGVSDDAYVQIYADTSEVDIWEPGVYEVDYSISYDELTVNRIAHVKVEEPSTSGGSSKSSTSKGGNNSSSNNQGYEDETTGIVEKDIDSAKIDLLSGGVATVKQTNLRFIEETYTENSNIERNGRNYLVSKLIVKFNTGELQVLETIEHPVD